MQKRLPKKVTGYNNYFLCTFAVKQHTTSGSQFLTSATMCDFRCVNVAIQCKRVCKASTSTKAGTKNSNASWRYWAVRNKLKLNDFAIVWYIYICLRAVGFQACKDDYKGSSKLAKGTGPLQVHIARRHAKSRRLRTWSSQRQAPCLKAKNCVFSRYSGIMWHLNLCCLSSSLFSISLSRSPSSSPLYIVVLLPSHSL